MKALRRSELLAERCRWTRGEPTSKSHLPDSSSSSTLVMSGNEAPMSSDEIAIAERSSADACDALTWGISPLERFASGVGGNSIACGREAAILAEL